MERAYKGGLFRGPCAARDDVRVRVAVYMVQFDQPTVIRLSVLTREVAVSTVGNETQRSAGAFRVAE